MPANIPLRHRLLGVVLAASLGLTACGGSTVTSEEVSEESSVAPLERSTDKESETDSQESESTSRSSKKETDEPRAGGGAAAPAPKDQGAQEIDEIPRPEPEASGEEEKYLAALGEDGIETADYEDVLVSTAWTVCSEDEVANTTAAAVAGQLVAQGRTDLDEGAVTRAIETNAREIYCP